MVNKWKTTTLGEIALGKDGAVDGPFGSNLPASCYVEIGTPVIRGSNLSKGLGEFKDEGFVFVPDDIQNKLSRCNCVAGDIIFTKKGTLGQTGIIRSEHRYTRYILSSNQMRLRVNQDLALPEYVYYWVSSQKSILKLIKDSESTGVPKINLGYLRSFPIELPSINEQQNIVGVLKSINSKIELNQQTNQTLEAMAQTLFKSWFVDFDPVFDNLLAKADFKLENLASDFPEALLKRAQQRLLALDDKAKKALFSTNLSSEVKSPEETSSEEASQTNIHKHFPSEFEHNEQLGWIPKGWGVKEADKVADISIGKTPPRKQKEWFSDDSLGNIVWTSIRDMGGDKTFIGDSNEYLIPESISKFNVKVIPKDSVILSFKLTLGRVSITKCDLATNEAIAHFVNLKHSLSKEYVYLYLKCFEYSSLGSTSSIATAVNSKIIKAMPFLVPNENVLNQFKSTVENIFSKIDSIGNQTDSLTKLRDTLLPKLISGELQIPEADS